MDVADRAPLTKAEVKHLCRSVTPEIRDFAQSNLGHAGWPEDFLRGAGKNPSEDLTQAPPVTVQQWWTWMFDRVVLPDPEVWPHETE